MRLLKRSADGSFGLTNFADDSVPPYAVLSHTWSRDPNDEVIFEEIDGSTQQHYEVVQRKPGFEKMRFCADRVAGHDLEYFWMDTCCIKKSDSTELTEAINSMFRWYARAERCYVYLTDVSAGTTRHEEESNGDASTSITAEWDLDFRNSRWFTRGWTLQELLAPRRVEFYSREHTCLGDKLSLEHLITDITGISVKALKAEDLTAFSLEERLSWSRKRETTRSEDRAYSLFGICGIYLPLIYGEGEANAMRRLEEEIAARKLSASTSLQIEPLINATGNVQINGEMNPRKWSNPCVSFTRIDVCVEQLDSKVTPFSNTPFPRDPDFIQRGDLLDQIEQRLSRPASRVAIGGLGGVGKSQQAIQYSYRVREKSPQTYVFWIYGATAAKFEEAYRMAAERLSLITTESQNADALKRFHNWLKDDRHGPWLMIVDNADDSSVFFASDTNGAGTTEGRSSTEPVMKYLPQTPNGRILFTSRSEELASRLAGGYQNLIKLGSMNDHESASLFHRKRVQLQNGKGDNEQDVGELLKAIEYIPLAITQAAAYINRAGPRGSVKRYLKLYNENELSRDSLLRFDGGDLRRSDDARNSIILTWQISFEQIAQERQSAADLLSVMCFFHWQNIPEFALMEVVKDRLEDTKEDAEIEFEDDIAYLLNYALITSFPEKEIFEMHRLVHISTRRWLASKNCSSKWQQTFLRTLSRIYPSGAFENWSFCRPLLPHAEYLLANDVEDSVSRKYCANILYNAATYTNEIGQYNTAKQMVIKSLAIRKDLLGPDDPDTFRCRILVAAIALNQNLFKKAGDMYREIVKDEERVLGPEHRNTLECIDSLGMVLLNQGKLDESLTMIRRALEGREKVLGPKHVETLTSISHMGTLMSFRNNYSEAIKWNRRAFEERETALGSDNPHTLISARNVVATLTRLGEFDEADKLGRVILEKSENVLGSRHPDTLMIVHSMADLRNNQRKYVEGESICRRALEGRKAILGPENSDTWCSLGVLATCLNGLGRSAEAEAMYSEQLQKLEAILGQEHPDTLLVVRTLAICQHQQGKCDEAEVTYRRALEERERSLGPEHPMTMKCEQFMADWLKDRNRDSEAEPMYRTLAKKLEKTLGRGHIKTINSTYNLAFTLHRQGKYEEAEKLYRKTLEGFTQALGGEHNDTQFNLYNLALVLSNNGKHEEAVEMMQRVLEIRQRLLGPDNENTERSKGTLSYVLAQQEKAKDGEDPTKSST